MMKLYKFKSLANIEHVIDIIKNQQLYAAPFMALNDPMEGSFQYDINAVTRESIEKMLTKKQQINICSFSKEYTNPLLWAHYAENFSGVCFEVEINPATIDGDLKEIEYEDSFPHIAEPSYVDPQHVLSRKVKSWKYEKETRVFTAQQYVKKLKIKAIFMGLRISENMKWLLSELCYFPRIDLFETYKEGAKIKVNTTHNCRRMIDR
jgi:hypothetical protein